MARTPTAAALLLCVCTAHLATTYGSSVNGWAPEHLRNLLNSKSPLEVDSSSSGPARRLQQDQFENPDVAPFTFDGFSFGFGGLLPSNTGLFPFYNNLYQILFRNIFNTGLGQYFSQDLPNDVDVYRLLPRELQDLFGSDPVTVLGYDAVDRFLGQYLSLPEVELGDRIPAGCIGPIYSLVVDGGTCEIQDDGKVECEQPTITIKSTPLVCNLPYKAACSMTGKSFRYQVAYGASRSGEIGPPAGVYNFGTSVNITRAWLGFNLATRRVVNDFGLKNWYNFFANWAQLELVRIGSAIADFAVAPFPGSEEDDSTDEGEVLTRSSSTGAAALRAGLADLTDAGARFATKVADRLGIPGVDPKNLLQMLTGGRLGRFLRPRSRAPATPSARAATAASDDPLAALLDKGLPQTALQTQQFVSDALAGERSGDGQKNPYALQTDWAAGGAAAAPRQSVPAGAPEGAGTAQPTLGVGPSEAEAPEASPAVDGVVLGEQPPPSDAQEAVAALDDMLGGELGQQVPGAAELLTGEGEGVTVDSNMQEEGDQALLAEQTGGN